MTEAADDFIYLPQYFSPWMTPPKKSADLKHKTSSPISAMEKNSEIVKDGDKNTILGWIKENTRMNFVHCKINVTRTNEGSKLSDISAMKFSSMDRQLTITTGRPPPPQAPPSSPFYSPTPSFHTPLAQSSPFIKPPPPSSSSPNGYFYDKTDFTTNNKTNNKRYTNNDIQQSSDRQQHKRKQISNFYHLACVAPDDVEPVHKAIIGTTSRVGCHGDVVGGDDDDDEVVFQFLETYRKAPELTKFQAKVYLELSKDPSNMSMFLCPDDSKRFITIHDFSATNHIKACNNNNKLININNNNSNGITSDGSDVDQFKVIPRSDLSSDRGHETPPTFVGRFDRTTYAKTYAFDRIFMPDESTTKVYIESVTPVLKAVLSGHSGCVVCYGEPDSLHKTKHHHTTNLTTLTGLTLRWLYSLLEETSHDVTSTFSLKVSAIEFVGTSDSIKDLLIDVGMRSKNTKGGENQPRYIRVSNLKEACEVHRAALGARSDNSVNMVFTIHLRQYQARLPNQQRVVSLSNQLHIINISDRQKEQIQKGMNKSHPQSRDGPLTSLVGKENLLQFIGSLMIGQRMPLASLSKLHNLLQNCILPSNVQCQTSLIIRLRPHQTFTNNNNNNNYNNINNNYEVQKLLNLGTKIYKRRFSKYKHMKYSVQPFLMNSSASETSSCASSGLSNLRKSRVRMGTQHWQKKLDPVPAHCSASIPGQARDFQTHFNWSANPSRPNHLELEHKFAPRIGSDRFGTPPSSLIRNHWKACGRVQDTILEHPEDRWDRAGRTATPSETWIDGPAAIKSHPYDNIKQRGGYSDTRPHRTNEMSFESLGPGRSFQSSIQTRSSFTTNQSQSMNFITNKNKISRGIEPIKSFDSYDRLIQNAGYNERYLSKHLSKYRQSPMPFSSSVMALGRPNQQLNDSVNKPSNQRRIRKSSLTNSDTAPQLGWREPMESLCNRLGSSSIYESWFEDKIEKGTTNLLTESFTANQSESLPTNHLTVDNHAQSNPKTSHANPQHDDYELIKMQRHNDKSSDKSSLSSKKNKNKFLKRFKRFFTKNPFKQPSSSSSSLSSPATLPKLVQPLDNDQPIKVVGGAPFPHRLDPIGRSSVKSPKKLNNSYDQAVKKSFSFFSRHKNHQKTDVIATAPTTPNIYYDNQAVSTLASANGSLISNFPSFTFPKSSNVIGGGDAKLEPRHSKSQQWPYAEVVGGDISLDASLSRRGLLSEGVANGPKGASFYAFIDDEDDEVGSQVESSVANVVCYRKMPFAKKGSDQSSKSHPTILAPSYYRFSKLSSDGDVEREELSINGCHGNDNNSNNNTGNDKKVNSHSDDYDDDDDDDDNDDVSDDYVRIKKLQVINDLSSSLSIIKNDDDDDDDHKSDDDDDYRSGGDDHHYKKSDQDDDDDVMKTTTLAIDTKRKKNKIVGFMPREKPLENKKTGNRGKRCAIQ